MVVVKDENKSYDKDPVWMFLRILLPPFCLDTTTNRDNSSFLNRNERAKKNVCDRPSDERWPHLTDDGRWKFVRSRCESEDKIYILNSKFHF